MFSFFIKKIINGGINMLIKFVATCLVATAAFGDNKYDSETDSCEDYFAKPVGLIEKAPACCPTQELVPTVAAYNFPARILTDCPLNCWVDGSFIYWKAVQENMSPAAFQEPTAPTQVSYINMNADYKPGYKIGIGTSFDSDDWELELNYTQFHQKYHKNGSIVPNVASLATGGFNPLWFDVATNFLAGGSAQPYFADEFQANWHLNLDFLDLDLGRSHFIGKKLTVHPFMGLRGALIDQQQKAVYLNHNPISGSIIYATPLNSDAKTTSRGIGPRAGFIANCNLSRHFRLYGSSEADLLYTSYKYRSAYKAFDPATGNIIDSTKYSQNIHTLRAHLDLELGLGLGSYFNCKSWHFDVTASYGFQVFWNQNMFRHFEGDSTTRAFGGLESSGDLFIHGLTVTGRLDF